MSEAFKIIPFDSKEISDKSSLQRFALKAFELLSLPSCISSEINTHTYDLYSFSIVSRSGADSFLVEINKVERKLSEAMTEIYSVHVWRDNPTIGRQEVDFNADKSSGSWDISVDPLSCDDMADEIKREDFIDSFLKSQVDLDETKKLSVLLKETKSSAEQASFEIFGH